MLFLLFQLDDDRYALDANEIAAVLPLVALKKIPAAPTWVAGIFSYQDQLIPVIDICQLALARPAQSRLSTRLVLVHFISVHQGQQLLGLIVEKAHTTVRSDPSAFRPYGIDNPDARYLGPVLEDANDLIQWIKIEELLPESIQNMLFQPLIDC